MIIKTTLRLIAGVVLFILTNIILISLFLTLFFIGLMFGWISGESLGGYAIGIFFGFLYLLIAPVIIKKLGIDSLLAGRSPGDNTIM